MPTTKYPSKACKVSGTQQVLFLLISIIINKISTVCPLHLQHKCENLPSKQYSKLHIFPVLPLTLSPALRHNRRKLRFPGHQIYAAFSPLRMTFALPARLSFFKSPQHTQLPASKFPPQIHLNLMVLCPQYLQHTSLSVFILTTFTSSKPLQVLIMTMCEYKLFAFKYNMDFSCSAVKLFQFLFQDGRALYIKNDY